MPDSYPPTPSLKTHAHLASIVGELQDILWRRSDDTVDPNKEWDSGTLDRIAAVLIDHELSPKELAS